MILHKQLKRHNKGTEPKKNSSSKSPATGASSAVMAGAIAAAGAGIAVLAATKKKENELISIHIKNLFAFASRFFILLVIKII